MIKKSKKFLALSLSLVSLVSSMGSLNIHAMDGRCAKPEKLACCSADEMLPMGLTPEDLEEELIQQVFGIYKELEEGKEGLTFVLDEAEKVGECSSLSDCYKKDTVHTLRSHAGNCRMISNRFIFEFLKRKLNKTDEFVKICPLTVAFANETSHIAVALITTKKVYIIDLSSDLQDRSEHRMTLPVPYIFTAQKYIEYMNHISLNNPIFFGVIEEDISTCTKKSTECFSTPLEMVCQISDLFNRDKEMPSSLKASDECMSVLGRPSSEEPKLHKKISDKCMSDLELMFIEGPKLKSRKETSDKSNRKALKHLPDELSHDKNPREIESQNVSLVMGKYKVPAAGKGIKNMAFSFLTGRDTNSGIKNDSLEIISYEDLVETPLLSEILPTEIAKKMSEGTAIWMNYHDAAEFLSKKGKKLSDEDADKFITEYLKNIDKCDR